MPSARPASTDVSAHHAFSNETDQKNKKNRDKKDELSNELAAKEESYYPVECETCGTKVAVMDEEEVFHFFNAIPS